MNEIAYLSMYIRTTIIFPSFLHSFIGYTPPSTPLRRGIVTKTTHPGISEIAQKVGGNLLKMFETVRIHYLAFCQLLPIETTQNWPTWSSSVGSVGKINVPHKDICDECFSQGALHITTPRFGKFKTRIGLNLQFLQIKYLEDNAYK